MTDFQAAVGRTDPMCSMPTISDPVISPAEDSPPLDPIRTMQEHLVASVARVEARMDDVAQSWQQDRGSFYQPDGYLPPPNPDPPYALPAFVNHADHPIDWQQLQVRDLRPPDVAPPYDMTHRFDHHQDRHQPQPTLLYQQRHPPVANTGFHPSHAQPPDHLEWQQLYYDQNFATSASGQPQPELPSPPYQSERYPLHEHPWSTTALGPHTYPNLDPVTLHQSPTTGHTNNAVTDSYTLSECSTLPPIGYELDGQRRTSQFYYDWQPVSRPSGPPFPDPVPHPPPAMLPRLTPLIHSM